MLPLPAINYPRRQPSRGAQFRRLQRTENEPGPASLVARESDRRQAARNVLGLGRVLTAVSESLRGYYVIGYSPEELDLEESQRNIRIEVNRTRLNLDYRKSYYELTPFDRLSPTERSIDLHHYLKHDVPFTDIPLTLAYDFFRGDDGEAVLHASVGIHSSYLPVGKKKKRSEIRFIALAQARNVEGRRDPFYVQKDVQVRASAKYLEAFRQARGAVLHVPIEMKLEPGKYEWKVVLRNEHSGDIGTYKTVHRFSGPCGTRAVEFFAAHRLLFLRIGSSDQAA